MGNDYWHCYKAANNLFFVSKGHISDYVAILFRQNQNVVRRDVILHFTFFVHFILSWPTSVIFFSISSPFHTKRKLFYGYFTVLHKALCYLKNWLATVGTCWTWENFVQPLSNHGLLFTVLLFNNQEMVQTGLINNLIRHWK